MACEGLKPVVAIYSTFLQRAYDQLIHDICLQDLDVTLAVDRAGPVGADGATHAGSFDLSYCRCLPNMLIMAPADENECRRMLQTAYEYPGPAMVRYPRGTGPGVSGRDRDRGPAHGEGRPAQAGPGHGAAGLRHPAGPGAGGWRRPWMPASSTCASSSRLDDELILEMARTHRLLVTLEENAVAGGAGSAVAELLAREGVEVRCLHLGLPDRFLDQASQQEQLAECGLDVPGITAAVRDALRGSAPGIPFPKGNASR